MKRCIIFAAGSYYGLRVKPEKDDLILAADAGFHACRGEGIVPNILLGDFDSTEKPDVGCPVISYPPEKDDTDTILAIRAALAKGYREIHILGGTGGQRIDHTIANVQALDLIARSNAHGFLYDRSTVFTVIRNETVHIPLGRKDGILSVFSLYESAENVTLEGVKYPMKNGHLDGFFPLGISNCITEKTAVVSVGQGSLLIGVELPEEGICEFKFMP